MITTEFEELKQHFVAILKKQKLYRVSTYKKTLDQVKTVIFISVKLNSEAFAVFL